VGGGHACRTGADNGDWTCAIACAVFRFTPVETSA